MTEELTGLKVFGGFAEEAQNAERLSKIGKFGKFTVKMGVIAFWSGAGVENTLNSFIEANSEAAIKQAQNTLKKSISTKFNLPAKRIGVPSGILVTAEPGEYFPADDDTTPFYQFYQLDWLEAVNQLGESMQLAGINPNEKTWAHLVWFPAAAPHNYYCPADDPKPVMVFGGKFSTREEAEARQTLMMEDTSIKQKEFAVQIGMEEPTWQYSGSTDIPEGFTISAAALKEHGTTEGITDDAEILANIWTRRGEFLQILNGIGGDVKAVAEMFGFEAADIENIRDFAAASSNPL